MKVPRPDNAPEELGLTVMDEPTTKGVDKYILEMELAENTKAKIDRINVKSIQNAEKKPNEISDWINKVDDLPIFTILPGPCRSENQDNFDLTPLENVQKYDNAYFTFQCYDIYNNTITHGGEQFTVDANAIYLGNDYHVDTAEVIDNTTSRGRTLRFLFDGSNEEFHKVLKQLGKTPLPDDILRLRDLTKEDNERYQTIYAANEGAVVAPTAGFHFSRELLKRMEIKGINRAFITLHCGLGNFRQIEVEDLSKHKMDSEEMILNEETAAIINNTKKDNKKVCIIGTTTMKAVESAATINGKVKVFSGWTNKFIIPDYEFQIADAMITNFHKPLSSMLIMACSFGGYDLIMKAYQEAIENNYKFLTYGDAMLII